MEMYKAYKEGRAEKDPSEAWYQGELGFFDFYIVSFGPPIADPQTLNPFSCAPFQIPLAKKLKECGVFGVSSDEFLNYAMNNRKDWVANGEQAIQKYLETYEERYGI